MKYFTKFLIEGFVGMVTGIWNWDCENIWVVNLNGSVLKRWGLEDVFEISHHHFYIELHHLYCIALYSLVWFDIVFEYLPFHWITIIEPYLWYCVFCIHFHYIITSYYTTSWLVCWNIYEKLWLWHSFKVLWCRTYWYVMPKKKFHDPSIL